MKNEILISALLYKNWPSFRKRMANRLNSILEIHKKLPKIKHYKIYFIQVGFDTDIIHHISEYTYHIYFCMCHQ